MPFGLEVSGFYFTPHLIVKGELSIALGWVRGARLRMEGGGSVVQWQEKANSVNLEQWKISFEKSLESTRKLKNGREMIWA